MPLALPLLTCLAQNPLPLRVSAIMVLMPEYASSIHCFPKFLLEVLNCRTLFILKRCLWGWGYISVDRTLAWLMQGPGTSLPPLKRCHNPK